MMKWKYRIVLVFILPILITACANATKTPLLLPAISSKEPAITLAEETQVKEVIQRYFEALDNHELHNAYSLWAPDKAGSEEVFVDLWQSVQHVQIISIKGYGITPQGPVDLDKDSKIATVNFGITVDIKDNKTNSTINGIFTFFPNVQKSPNGSWLINGLGTSR